MATGLATDAGAPRIAEEEALRADFYGLLAALLHRPPSVDLLARCGALAGGSDPLGRAVAALAEAARSLDARQVSREHHDLFIGLGRGELVPYASYYLTGFLNEKPLATLRADMAALGVARAEHVSEPEDHIASLCDVMAGLIRGAFHGPVPLARQRDMFNRHLAPWAEHFFADLEGAEAAAFYAPVGAMGRLFIDIERTAFRMAA